MNIDKICVQDKISTFRTYYIIYYNYFQDLMMTTFQSRLDSFGETFLLVPPSTGGVKTSPDTKKQLRNTSVKRLKCLIMKSLLAQRAEKISCKIRRFFFSLVY